jgi:hypothetical protein
MLNELIQRIRQGHRNDSVSFEALRLPDRFRGRPAIRPGPLPETTLDRASVVSRGRVAARGGRNPCARHGRLPVLRSVRGGKRRRREVHAGLPACGAAPRRPGDPGRIGPADGSAGPCAPSPLRPIAQAPRGQRRGLQRLRGRHERPEHPGVGPGALRHPVRRSPRHADGLFVTGPVSENMRLALLKTWARSPPPGLHRHRACASPAAPSPGANPAGALGSCGEGTENRMPRHAREPAEPARFSNPWNCIHFGLPSLGTRRPTATGGRALFSSPEHHGGAAGCCPWICSSPGVPRIPRRSWTDASAAGADRIARTGAGPGGSIRRFAPRIRLV